MADLVFLGTPEAAVAPLEALVAAGHRVRLVVTQPDRRRGRGGALVPSPVKRAAVGLGLPVSDQLGEVVGIGADVGVVVAYGKIIPQRILDQVPMVNVHFSLLPRWRGAAPVERAILAGDEVTGVCLMRLEAGLDTGPVLQKAQVPILPDEHASALTERLAVLGARLLVEALAGGVERLGPGVPQEGQPTYAHKIDPAELCIDWDQPAAAVLRQIRLDRAYTTFRGQRLRILRAELDTPPGAPVDTAPGAPVDTAPGAPVDTVSPGTVAGVARVVAGDGLQIALVEVQPEGRRPMAATAWWHGARPEPGEQLGQVAVHQ